jgi:hypothetical protein
MSIAATIIVAAGVTLTVRHASIDSDLTRSARMIDGPIPQPIAEARSSPAASPAPVAAATDSLAPATSPASTNRPTAAKTPPSSNPVVEPAPPPPAPAVTAQAEKTIASAEKKAALDANRDAAKDVASTRVADSVRPLAQPAVERRQAVMAAAATVGQLREVATTNARDAAAAGLILEDCYRLDVDSTDWRGVLPTAFSLGGSSSESSAGAGVAGAPQGASAAVAGGARPASRAFAPTADNPVHAVTPGGRVDSLVVGAWKRTGPQLVTVHFAANDRHKPITLLLTSTGSTAQLISSNGTDSVRVARSTCSR